MSRETIFRQSEVEHDPQIDETPHHRTGDDPLERHAGAGLGTQAETTLQLEVSDADVLPDRAEILERDAAVSRDDTTSLDAERDLGVSDDREFETAPVEAREDARNDDLEDLDARNDLTAQDNLITQDDISASPEELDARDDFDARDDLNVRDDLDARDDFEQTREPDAEAGASQVDASATDQPTAAEAAADLRADQQAERTWSEDDPGWLQQRWQELQLRFVDDPRSAAVEAKTLAEQVVNRLTTHWQDELQSAGGWGDGEQADTEQLRIAVRRYRELFEKLIHI